jgi:hypothetical protein
MWWFSSAISAPRGARTHALAARTAAAPFALISLSKQSDREAAALSPPTNALQLRVGWTAAAAAAAVLRAAHKYEPARK